MLVGAVEDSKIEGRKNQDSNFKEAEIETQEEIFSYNPIQSHYSILHNCWTNTNAANRVLIETHQTKISQSSLFNSRTSPSSGATSNFTKNWRWPTKNVEIGSNTTGFNEVSKIPAKNQPFLSKGETLVAKETEYLDLLVEELESQDLLVKELESQDLLVIFNSYIEE